MIRAMKSHRDGSLLQLLLPCWDFNEECAMILSVCHAVGGFRHCTFAALVVRIALFSPRGSLVQVALAVVVYNRHQQTTTGLRQEGRRGWRGEGRRLEGDADWKEVETAAGRERECEGVCNALDNEQTIRIAIDSPLQGNTTLHHHWAISSVSNSSLSSVVCRFYSEVVSSDNGTL